MKRNHGDCCAQTGLEEFNPDNFSINILHVHPLTFRVIKVLLDYLGLKCLDPRGVSQFFIKMDKIPLFT